jgi:Asp-tRNA(Asn)/Glu-tRNA(Gln) amidotransferase A subunit family amidase
MRTTRMFDVLGTPGISVPCGVTSAGLPIGLQIIGAPGADAAVLRLAAAYEAATR